MITDKMNELMQILISELESKSQIHISECIKSESEISLVIDPVNRLFVEIEENGVTILYADEHDEFWIAPSKNEEAFINDVIKFITLLLQNTILIEYVHSKNTLLSYKIWAIDKDRGQKILLKKVTTSINPFLRLLSKSTSSKEICFKNR